MKGNLYVAHFQAGQIVVLDAVGLNMVSSVCLKMLAHLLRT